MSTFSRRKFIKTTGAVGMGLSMASSMRRVYGANERVVVGMIGVNARGGELAQGFARAKGAEVGFICDVDERAIATCAGVVSKIQGKTPDGIEDIRKLLDNKDVDAVAIAAPDHWHAIAGIMALKAGKHVYVEKPGSHNITEGQLLVKAQEKYKKLCQLGTQQRSNPIVFEAAQLLREGTIGRPYLAKCWYSNTRKSIGVGKEAPVPGWLNYDLWQGAAPRVAYKDNVVHYNWHWFRNWGTGEACNNGTHQVDVCRWLLEVGHPTKVTSAGGRFHDKDDWEYFDTQLMSFEFEGGKAISWEGRSCNGMSLYGRNRGIIIHGTEGSMLVDEDGYIVYEGGRDPKEKLRKIQKTGTDAVNTVGGGILTDLHTANFANAILGKNELAQPIARGQDSVLLCHLGNIAQFTGGSLKIDPKTGKILGNAAALKLTKRSYHKGWAPTV